MSEEKPMPQVQFRPARIHTEDYQLVLLDACTRCGALVARSGFALHLKVHQDDDQRWAAIEAFARQLGGK